MTDPYRIDANHIRHTGQDIYVENMKCAEDLRNNLAHSQHDLSHGSSWDVVMLTISFIERLLDRSDQLIEEASAASATASAEKTST